MAKIIINKEALSKTLAAMAPAFPSKELLGTDGLLKFELRGDSCIVYVINSKVQMSAFIKCTSDASLEFCVHNRIMREMVRTFPDGDLVIETDGDPVKSISMKPEGQRKKYKIACNVSSDFPNMPFEPGGCFELNMPAGFFASTIKTMAGNVDAGNVVTTLANINACSIDGKLTFVAGSQYLLSFVKTDIDCEKQFTMPVALNDYISFFTGLENCKILVTDNTLFIMYAGYNISVSLIEGKISNYKAILDQEPEEIDVMFPKKELLESTNRLAIFTDELGRIIMNVTETECEMIGINHEWGNEGSEVIQVSASKETQFGLKHSIIKKVCGSIQTDTIHFKRKEHTAFIRPESGRDIIWIASLSKI